jgi:hypothetical protein
MVVGSGRAIPWIVISRITGIALFILIIILLNGLFVPAQSPVANIIIFLNQNVRLVVIFSLVFLAAEVVGELPNPFRFLAPPINAAGSVLLVTFFLRMLSLVDTITGTEIFGKITVYSSFILPLVFVGVLIGGIIAIYAGEAERRSGDGEDQIG